MCIVQWKYKLNLTWDHNIHLLDEQLWRCKCLDLGAPEATECSGSKRLLWMFFDYKSCKLKMYRFKINFEIISQMVIFICIKQGSIKSVFNWYSIYTDNMHYTIYAQWRNSNWLKLSIQQLTETTEALESIAERTVVTGQCQTFNLSVATTFVIIQHTLLISKNAEWVQQYWNKTSNNR